LWTAAPLVWFYRLSFPFIWVLHRSSQLILKRLGIGADELHGGHSEEELRVVLAAAQSSPDRRDLILNALDLRHRTAREVMRPRNEITVFDSGAPIAECIAIAEKTRYSRFPVCDDGDPDKAHGIVHIKDLYALREKAGTAADLLPVSRKLICVPETARLEKLLRRFLEKKSHFALVVDEFGGTLGIVTLENALEALVGQIQDEFDAEVTQFIRRSDNDWVVSGALPLHDLEKIIGESGAKERALGHGRNPVAVKTRLDIRVYDENPRATILREAKVFHCDRLVVGNVRPHEDQQVRADPIGVGTRRRGAPNCGAERPCHGWSSRDGIRSRVLWIYFEANRHQNLW